MRYVSVWDRLDDNDRPTGQLHAVKCRTTRLSVKHAARTVCELAWSPHGLTGQRFSKSHPDSCTACVMEVKT